MTNNAQLDSQLSKMINEFNKQRASGLICDTECQNNQNITKMGPSVQNPWKIEVASRIRFWSVFGWAWVG